MSAVVIVDGVLEGLQLIANISQALSTVSTAVAAAQQTGQPLDLTAVLADVSNGENAVLTAIAAARASGR